MREAVARAPVILLPLGSFEDQGPHMPIGDYLLADVMAEKIARKSARLGMKSMLLRCCLLAAQIILDICRVVLLFLKPLFRPSCGI
nr:creatininase family protein [Acetobacter persici]